MRYYKVVIGDSRNMSEVQNNSVDLVVTSPPYWTLEAYSREGDKGADDELGRYHTKDDFFNQIARTWAECERVLRPGGVLVCDWGDYPPGSRYFGYPREICLCGPMVESIEWSGLILISRWIVKKWESGAALKKAKYTMYDNLRSAIPRAMANWDYVFAFYKKGYKPKMRKPDFTRKEWIEWSDGVWNIPFKGTGLDISGGATFPVEFAKRCIRIYSMPGDVILDPFLGTGTTMKASFELGRSCIGYEVLERMLPIIKDKVNFGQQNVYEEVKWEVKVR